jgi:hypothetical protein
MPTLMQARSSTGTRKRALAIMKASGFGLQASGKPAEYFPVA